MRQPWAGGGRGGMLLPDPAARLREGLWPWVFLPAPRQAQLNLKVHTWGGGWLYRLQWLGSQLPPWPQLPSVAPQVAQQEVEGGSCGFGTPVCTSELHAGQPKPSHFPVPVPLALLCRAVLRSLKYCRWRVLARGELSGSEMRAPAAAAAPPALSLLPPRGQSPACKPLGRGTCDPWQVQECCALNGAGGRLRLSFLFGHRIGLRLAARSSASA